jgi:hypothetical protein
MPCAKILASFLLGERGPPSLAFQKPRYNREGGLCHQSQDHRAPESLRIAWSCDWLACSCISSFGWWAFVSRWPWRGRAARLLLSRSCKSQHLENPKGCRCAEECLGSPPVRAAEVTLKGCLSLSRAFLKEALCVSSSMQLSEMSGDKKCLSAWRLPDTYVTRKLASALQVSDV